MFVFSVLMHKVVAVTGVQAGKYPACAEGDAADEQEGVAEGAVDVFAVGMGGAEQVEQQGAECDAEADGQLLVDGDEAAAAAGLQGAQVGNCDGVHGGVLQGVAKAEDEELRDEQPQRCGGCGQG